MAQQLHVGEHRRSPRIVASISLEAEMKGRWHQVLTAVINLNGALILSPADWPAGSGLKIKNANTGIDVNARVVWCGHESDSGYKLGIEFETASPEFWGESYDPHGVEVPWSK
jgi:hypothetical protein